MVHLGEADALITGMVGRFQKKLDYIMDIIGLRPDGKVIGTLGVLNTDEGTVFV